MVYSDSIYISKYIKNTLLPHATKQKKYIYLRLRCYNCYTRILHPEIAHWSLSRHFREQNPCSNCLLQTATNCYTYRPWSLSGHFV